MGQAKFFCCVENYLDAQFLHARLVESPEIDFAIALRGMGVTCKNQGTFLSNELIVEPSAFRSGPCGIIEKARSAVCGTPGNAYEEKSCFIDYGGYSLRAM